MNRHHRYPWHPTTSQPLSASEVVAVTLQLFPDNTVLINFAYIHRMDLLSALARNGAWCATVEWECKKSAAQPDLGDLLQARDMFGSPMRPQTQNEHLMTQTFRTQLAEPGDGPEKHLGEAETLAIIGCRSLRAIFVTDDRGARTLAAQQGLTVITTWELLKAGAHSGLVDHDLLWSYLSDLHKRGRGAPPHVHDRESFEHWLAA